MRGEKRITLWNRYVRFFQNKKTSEFKLVRAEVQYGDVV